MKIRDKALAVLKRHEPRGDRNERWLHAAPLNSVMYFIELGVNR